MNLHSSATQSSISSLAVVHPNAIIGKSVTIEPFAIVEEDVVIGDQCYIGSSAVLRAGTRLGHHCRVFSGAILGSIPQDLKFQGEYSTLVVGDYTVVREYCTLNRGTAAAGTTYIGSNCLLMSYVHVAHDCVIGDHCILANTVNLAGHVEIEDYAILGGMVGIHQFVRIGAHAIISGGSMVGKDVPPYVKAAHFPITYAGVNVVGLRRRGFTADQINTIHDLYRLIYTSGLNTSQAINKVAREFPPSPERDAILAFVEQSKRGMMRKPMRGVVNDPEE